MFKTLEIIKGPIYFFRLPFINIKTADYNYYIGLPLSIYRQSVLKADYIFDWTKIWCGIRTADDDCFSADIANALSDWVRYS